MLPRLLYLSAHLPGPEASQAGHKTAFRHLRWLAERYEVSFVGFANSGDQKADQGPVRSLCRDVHVQPVSRWTRIIGALSAPRLPWLVAARWQRDVHRLVRDRLGSGGFSRVHVEWAQMAQYIPQGLTGIETWISAADVMYLGAERNAERSSGLRRRVWQGQARGLYRWERDQYARVDTVLLHNPKDGQLVSRMLGSDRNVRVISPYFDRYTPRLRNPGTGAPRLLFWGSMGRTENSEAAEWLVREVLPRLRSQMPGARLIIAGSNPPHGLVQAASDAVEVTGFVKDPQAVFDRADAAVLPLFRGAGVKVKVIECLAAGLPVITTAVGAEGIEAGLRDGLTVLEANAEAFVGKIVALASGPERWAGESQAAIEWGRRLGDGDRALLFR
mgnify:CR=1 FL=1